MAAATVVISEVNTAGATPTSNISNMNMGSVDGPNLVLATSAISPNTYSYEKWWRFEVTNMGTSTAIQNLKVWMTGTFNAPDTILTNLDSTGSYSSKSRTKAQYVTPINTVSTYATKAMPTVAAVNCGIAGALAGQLTTTDFSDFFVVQIKVDTSSTVGQSVTMNFQYDEIA